MEGATTMRVKTSPTRTKRVSSADADHAARIAFQKLYHQAEEESKAAQRKRRAAKYQQWQGAAKRFKGLSEALRLRVESRNIHVSGDGYVVSFLRKGESFKRYFRGLNDASLAAAIEFRDKAAAILGPINHSVPAQVLKALDLPAPVPGISRTAQGSYSVSEESAARTGLPRSYPLEFLSEEDAYAAAIECLEASSKAK